MSVSLSPLLCVCGQLITSAVQEDGYELSLTLTFALRDNKDPFVGRKLGISTHKGYLSQMTERDSLASGSEDEISELCGLVFSVAKSEFSSLVWLHFVNCRLRKYEDFTA